MIWGLIATDVIDYEEAAEYGSIDINVDDFYEEGQSGSGEAVVITGVTEVVIKEVEEVQQAVKYSSL